MARTQDIGTYSIKLKRQIGVFKRAGMKQIADGVANVYAQQIRRSFSTGGYKGGKWKENAPSYAKRFENKKPLILTGRMRRTLSNAKNFKTQVLPNGFSIKIYYDRWGRMHNWGTGKDVQRQFVGHDDKTEREVNSVVQKIIHNVLAS